MKNKKKKVNYERLVNELNYLLYEKYNLTVKADPYLIFEDEIFRTYFTIELDNYNKEIILFGNLVVYSAMINSFHDHTEKEVKKEIKTCFNFYVDAISKMKLRKINFC